RPDLPTPETITRPLPAASRRTAAANAGPTRWATRPIASAPRASTPRPRSTRSPGSVRDIATLPNARREPTPPPAARPEDQPGHRQLTRPQRRGRRFPAREPHDDEPRRAQHPDAEPVLDVKALEFDGVIADDAEVDAVVGEHAVDVEADELQAAGNVLIK